MHIVQRPSAASVTALLEACELPTADLGALHFDHFFRVGSEEAPAAVGGLELYGKVALLRSLAVDARQRGTGCGRRLVAELERYALAQGVQALYLLTTTAETFFAALGYRIADRATAPAAIRGTREFSGLCPDSAVFMVKSLAAPSATTGDENVTTCKL